MPDTAFDGTPLSPAGQQPGGQGQQDQGTTQGGWGGSPDQGTNSTGRASEGTLQTGSQPGQRQHQPAPHPDQRQTQRQAPEGTSEYWARQYSAQAREGESLADFQDRHGQELSARLGRTVKEQQATRQEIAQLRDQNAHLLNQLQPLLEHFHSMRQREVTQQQMAQIPDDPLERNNYLLEQNLRMQQEQQQTAEQREEERQQWEEGQAKIEAIDATWQGELAEAVADPEFLEDFQTMTAMDLNGVRRFHGPEADDPFVDPLTGRETGETKGQALVRITQRNIMRDMAARGISIRQAVADFGRETRAALGIQQPAGRQQNGNGQHQQQHQGNGNGSQTAQRLGAESHRNQLARTVSSNPGARGGNSGAGEGFDPATASPEDVQQAIRNGFDYHGWLKATYGQPDPWGGGWGS